jgi:hypothetical protein
MRKRTKSGLYYEQNFRPQLDFSWMSEEAGLEREAQPDLGRRFKPRPAIPRPPVARAAREAETKAPSAPGRQLVITTRAKLRSLAEGKSIKVRVKAGSRWLERDPLAILSNLVALGVPETEIARKLGLEAMSIEHLRIAILRKIQEEEKQK